MDWREQKRAARAVVHDTMKIEARYYPDSNVTWETVHVRLKINEGLVGDDQGQGYAQQQTAEPFLIFWRAEKEPRNGAVVWLAEGEAYKIDNTMPPDDVTRTAMCSRLTDRQYASFFTVTT